MFLDKPPISLNAIQKCKFTGSHLGMRYLLIKEEGMLASYVYPDRFCFEATKEEEKEKAVFSMDDSGYESCVKWLNEQYENNAKRWEVCRNSSYS